MCKEPCKWLKVWLELNNNRHNAILERLKVLEKAAPGLMKAIFDCRKAFAAGATVVEIMVILDAAVKDADNG